MFFSKKEFFNYLRANSRTAYYVMHRATNGTYSGDGSNITYKEACNILRDAKRRIANRELRSGDYQDGENLYKWYRPWHVVPELQNFSAPEGDFGIGVEVEMGFVSRAAAIQVATHIKDWKHVAIDEEGGAFPLEVTFPPICYSKLSNNSQVVRYLKYLNTVRDLVVNHETTHSVGTHVNVSIGGRRITNADSARMGTLNSVLQHRAGLTSDQLNKYFGRYPYGYAGNMGTHIEYKLFNSQLDPKRLRQYIDIAVSLTKLVAGNEVIDTTSVLAALEEGYNRRTRKAVAVANVSTPAVLDLPLAA